MQFMYKTILKIVQYIIVTNAIKQVAEVLFATQNPLLEGKLGNYL
jgi:Na+-transporting NADH:ubiquinone oxidoreductase subunit NqrE